MTKNILFHLASRIFDTPLLITQAKLAAILSAIGPRIGLEGSGLNPVEALTEMPLSQRYTEDPSSGIAVIPVYGSLVQRSMGCDPMSGLTSYEDLSESFQSAMDDPAVASILFDFDTPGGEVAGCFDFVDQIYAARGRKPIFGIADECALSAGYAIASACDRLFLPRTAFVGSIGVCMVHRDESQSNAQAGLTYTTFYAGDHKTDFTPYEPLTDSAKSVGQQMVEDCYQLFTMTVARNRGMSLASVIGTQAGVFWGQDAIKSGLADTTMNFDQVMEYMTTLKGVNMKIFGRKPKSEEVAVTEIPQLLDAEAEQVLPEESEAMPDDIKQHAISPGFQQGRDEGLTSATARAVAILALTEMTGHPIPMSAVQEIIASGASVDEARSRIMELASEQADKTEIMSTVSPTSAGGENPLIANARTRAEAAKKGAK